MDPAFEFVTTWRLEASPDQVWAALNDAFASGRPAWWPAVTGSPTVGLAEGASARLSVRSPWRYVLRVDLDLDRVDPGTLAMARARGDLVGRGELLVVPDGGGSRLDFVWAVELQRPWMRATAWVLGPAFRLAHTWVMVRGRIGFARSLRLDSFDGTPEAR